MLDADSPDEAITFIHGVVAQLPVELRDSILSRALVVSTKDAAEQFPANTTPQTLILKGGATPFASRFKEEGHQVIGVHGKNTVSRRTGIALLLPWSRALKHCWKSFVKTSREILLEKPLQLRFPAKHTDASATWQHRAETVGPRWPRTQALLLKIAKNWDADGKREDIEAGQRSLRYR